MTQNRKRNKEIIPSRRKLQYKGLAHEANNLAQKVFDYVYDKICESYPKKETSMILSLKNNQKSSILFDSSRRC